GRSTSIALDGTGNPHISYRDSTNNNLKYARWTGSEWNIETVDSDGDVGMSTSISLDSDDNPHISYYDGNLNLKYARWTGTEWNAETVDNINEGDFPRGTSIALDSHDNPHISYCHSGLYNLKYARWTRTEWFIETVDDEGAIGDVSSIALDSSDNPHISYARYGSNNILLYARWTGMEWRITEPDTSGDSVGSHSSMALDSIGNAYISYTEDSNLNLKYARSMIEAPGAPEGLQAVPGDKHVSLSWDAPSDDGGGSITQYNIHRGESSGNLSYHDSVDGNILSFNDIGLTNGQTYYYTVTAESDAGEGEFSDEVSAMPVGIPSVPHNVVAGAGDEQVTLSWNASADDGGSDITGYRIYRGTESGNLSYHYGVAGNIYSYIDTGLTNDQTYYYHVSAVNSAGEGDKSAEVSATPSSSDTDGEDGGSIPGFTSIILLIAVVTAVVIYHKKDN
ncbi:MAG: fibronectin type III domain-containing protein, partial [Candidatus Aenigmatarchaeota archaeon]